MWRRRNKTRGDLRIRAAGLFLLLPLLLCGCSSKAEMWEQSDGLLFLASETGQSAEMSEERGEETGDGQEALASSGQDMDGADGQADSESTGGETASVEAPPLVIYVHVCGAVENPGVVELTAGSRGVAAVEAAGGMREDADPDYVNLATVLTDGQKLYIPTKEEVEEWGNAAGSLHTGDSTGVEGAGQTVETSGQTVAGGGQNPADGLAADAGQTESGLVNINTASVSELCTLSGIGESRAADIVSYREKNGGFSSIEEIMNVSGIKEKVYAQIKDYITVQ